MIDYIEWAKEYSEDALCIFKVIEKKKALLNDKSLNADARKMLSDAIAGYRRIYRELIEVVMLLQERGGVDCEK